MGLLLDDPRLPLAGALVLLLVAGQVRWRIRRRRLVRRQRAEAFLRARHLAWVARQEEADRQRDAENARREQREREAVQQQARTIANQIGDGLARIQRMHDAPARQPSREPFSAVPVSAGGNRETAAQHRSRDAEKARSAEDEVRQLVYRCTDIDRDGWRRWRGSFDKEKYPRVWLGRKRGGFVPSYRLIYTWAQGPIPQRWTIDHACGAKGLSGPPGGGHTR